MPAGNLERIKPISAPPKPSDADILKARITTSQIKAAQDTERVAQRATAVAGSWAKLWRTYTDAAFDTTHAAARYFNPNDGILINAQRRLVNSVAYDPLIRAGEAVKIFTEEEEIGITPKTEVAKHGLAKLYRYDSPVPKKQQDPVPIVLAFARMNRPEIMDLAPGKSYVEFLVNQGKQVYLLDWGELKKGKTPGWQDEAKKDISDDVLGTIPALIDAMKKDSHAKQFDLQGWCQGAVLTSMYAAVQPERQPDAGLRKLVLLTPPLHFPENAGLLADMVRDPNLNLEALVAANNGVVPGELIDFGVKMRDPQKYMVDPYKAAEKAVGDPKKRNNMILMQSWMKKLTDLPGPWYLQFVNDMYRNDKLVQGKVVLTDKENGQNYRVDLHNVTVPVFIAGADHDDIAPPALWQDSANYFSGPTQVETIQDAGHISLMTGRKGVETWGKIKDFLDADIKPETKTVERGGPRFSSKSAAK